MAFVRTAARLMLLSLISLLGMIGISPAQDARLFFGNDDRQFVHADAYPFSALGKIVFEGGGHCTGALVSDHVVLTAAHCFMRGDDSPVYDYPLEFSLGHNKDSALATANVVNFWMPPGYLDDRRQGLALDNGRDYAFVLLDAPLGADGNHFGVHLINSNELSMATARRWTQINQAGYSGDYEDQLTAHLGCSIIDYNARSIVNHMCDIVPGDSGSPMFIEHDGLYEIIAVISAIYYGPRPYNIAVDSRAFSVDLNRYIQRYDAPLAVTAP